MRFFLQPWLFLAAALLAAGGLAACGGVRSVREALRPETPREQYAAALQEAGLSKTALGQAWHKAGRRALREALSVALPFREVGYFDPAAPAAVGYRFRARRGQQLRVRAAPPSADSARLFVDLFEVPADTSEAPRPLASADSTQTLDVDLERDGSYLLRVQPELLRGGRYALTIQAEASLAFPVSGTDSRAIRSVFGDPRDGGARQHHGVDIFAPRGTPVVAAAPGMVTRTGTSNLGGKIVWLRTGERRQALYYAHLDSQLVQPRTHVETGDTLGLVGNTGNARTTPPHLHFGIYADGPVDPYPFVHNPPGAPPVTADTSRLGDWSRVSGARLNLRAGPTTEAPVLRTLPRYAALRVDGSSGAWHRVQLPSGMEGFVAASLVEPASTPYRRLTLATGRPVLQQPAPTAAAVDSLGPGARAAVLGAFENFLYVAPEDQPAGWIAAE